MTDKEYNELKAILEVEEKRRAEIANMKNTLSRIEMIMKKAFTKSNLSGIDSIELKIKCSRQDVMCGNIETFFDFYDLELDEEFCKKILLVYRENLLSRLKKLSEGE